MESYHKLMASPGSILNSAFNTIADCQSQPPHSQMHRIIFSSVFSFQFSMFHLSPKHANLGNAPIQKSPKRGTGGSPVR